MYRASFRLVIALCFFLLSCSNSEFRVEVIPTEQPLSPVDPTPTDPKEEAPGHKTWNVAVISDLNRSYGSTSYTSHLDRAISHIRSEAVDLVLSTGDMVAGQKSGLDYQAMWSLFHSHVTKPLENSKIPLLPSPGNHDASSGSSFQKERTLYVQTFNNYLVERFNSQKNQEKRIYFLDEIEQNYPLNYAVKMGPAVFIALDATAVGPLINDQIGWLEEVLNKTSEYPIKIVFGHVPLYPFAFDKASEYLARGTASSGYGARMEDLLERHQVTYYFSGHHHVFYPGHRNGKVRYISVPLLGSGKRTLLTKDRTHKSRIDEGFLYLNFDDKGSHELVALRSANYEKMPWSALPPHISIPTKSSSDCSGCGSFPSSFFLNVQLRTLFNRLSF